MSSSTADSRDDVGKQTRKRTKKNIVAAHFKVAD